MARTSMHSRGLSETSDLESWIIRHPELVDPTLKIVTTQFDRWRTREDAASERLDVLAIASSGELVVIELKRGSDRKIHLQAITYAALVSGFTEASLAQAHAHWLSGQRGVRVSEGEALDELKAHVDDWSEDALALPRIVLVAESFAPQVLTTVEWLRSVAPNLQIECHEYATFDTGEAVTVAFDRIYPVASIEHQILRPTQQAEKKNLEKRAASQRRARSVAIIHEAQVIPDGAAITLELKGRARPEEAVKVDAWLDADERRRRVTWVDDPTAPLRWAAAADPSATWTPSALRNEIFDRAGAERPNFSASDAWSYNGKHLHEIAGDALSTAGSIDEP